ncbi:hypothetical protein PAHAL_3G185400 [Panicum hallii]|jgi:hypothetical protein|uniref:Uncharacterized protein n=1 Tax=Panicum hallii TaxID=206008 RepID=A0A2S3H9U4_9POAL|nr:hypothetical protein PAHAL_3G185400 [Panicum hallii]
MAQAQEPWLELLLIPPSRRLAAVRAAREVTFRRCRLQLHYRKFDNLVARLAEGSEEILHSTVIASICSPRGSVAAVMERQGCLGGGAAHRRPVRETGSRESTARASTGGELPA